MSKKGPFTLFWESVTKAFAVGACQELLQNRCGSNHLNFGLVECSNCSSVHNTTVDSVALHNQKLELLLTLPVADPSSRNNFFAESESVKRDCCHTAGSACVRSGVVKLQGTPTEEARMSGHFSSGKQLCSRKF